MNIRKHIPNTITCLNLVSGCIAVVMALQGNLLWATLWIIIAAVLDFMDGLAARLLNAYSNIGKDLDSLADVVSFGVAPGMMMFTILLATVQTFPPSWITTCIPYLAFIMSAFSGLRLARFNNDTRQTESFIGLPVPAFTLLWATAGYSLHPFIVAHPYISVPIVLICIIGTSLLMVSEIPMFSLKIKSLAWKGNELRYILIIASLLFIVFFGFLGLTFAIILYILLSIFNRKS